MSMEEYSAERPQDEPELEIVPIGDISEADAETIERRQEIMDEAKAGRARLLGEILQNKLRQAKDSHAANKAMNFLPIYGDLKLLQKAKEGKEGEKDLSGSRRALYAVAAASSLSAWAFLAMGEGEAFKGLKGTAEALQYSDAVLSLIQTAAHSLVSTNSRLAAIFAAAAGYLVARRTELQDMLDSSPITLGLAELENEHE